MPDDVPTPAPRPAEPTGPVVVIGGGPAGLTAAYALTRLDVASTVLEATDSLGGISQTVERDGWRFDIGGHRFFTKVAPVEQMWHDLLGPEEFLLRPRLSRIFYGGKFFDYPLRPLSAFRDLGPVEAFRCAASYGWVRLRPPRDRDSFEGFVAARFGWRLYRTFFKTYTEKVWGIPATELRADFAAQRIQDLSLMKAVLNGLLPKRNQKEIKTLIEEFHYPRLGPGQMWDRCADAVVAAGAKVEMNSPVERIERDDRGAVAVVTAAGARYPADHVVSTMPLSKLVHAMEPPAPDDVRAAADGLSYRDFLTVALVVPESNGFPDNWIYVHDPAVEVGRIQNFGSWSPDMVRPGTTCLGLEYFVFEGDELWTADDDDLIELATTELDRIGLVPRDAVQRGYVVRMPKAYPTYDPGYTDRVDTIRRWLDEAVPNVHPVGRNGMHRYNNQDHSMLTAMLAAENILGASHDPWTVNVDDEYHEAGTASGEQPTPGTGRIAPVLSR